MANRVVQAKVADLKPWDENPRTITDDRLEQLKRSLEAEREMLDARPLIALLDGTVIAGNQRLAAAQSLGWLKIPTVYVDLDRARALQWALRDNQPYGESAEDLTGALLAELSAAGADLDLTGYSSGEIDRLLRASAHSDKDPDAVPDLPAKPRSKLGEVYELGPHRLMCGDSTDLDAMREYLPDGAPLFVYADPPYGMNVVKVRGNGRGATGNVGGANPFGGKKGKVHGDARKAIIPVNEYFPVIGDDSTRHREEEPRRRC